MSQTLHVLPEALIFKELGRGERPKDGASCALAHLCPCPHFQIFISYVLFCLHVCLCEGEGI